MTGYLVRALLLFAAGLWVPVQEPAVITGRVVNSAGAPEAGVMVQIAVRSLRTVTGADGRYRLVIPAGSYAAGDSASVEMSRVGMRGQTRRVALRAGSLTVDFTAEAEALALESVVVTGGAATAGARGSAGAVSGKAPGAEGLTRDREPPPSPPPPPPMSVPEVTDAAAASGGRGEAAAAAGLPRREAGVLTAGMLDDFSRQGWREYASFLAEHESNEWALDPRDVLEVRITAAGRPLRDHPVTVEQGEHHYRMRTLPDGTLRIFPSLQQRMDDGPFYVTPAGGERRRLVLSPGLRRRGMIHFDQPRARVDDGAPVLDIGLMIDATGSMSDEMTYLQAELRDIVERVRPRGSPLRVRITTVYYRDRGDEFVTRVHPFDNDVDATVAFLGATRAGGGGDYPEEMNAALREMMAQEWSEGSAARMLFVVADAPPHPYPDAQYTWHDALGDANRRGIAIFPVAASGVDRETEALMRGMAVVTGGKYLFLTDHSGVGNPHLTPQQPFAVHRLNDLMVREIQAYVAGRFPALARYAQQSPARRSVREATVAADQSR